MTSTDEKPPTIAGDKQMQLSDAESETWLPVVGWESFYEVSDLGRVRSVARDVPGKLPGSMRALVPRILKPILRGPGGRSYPTVNMSGGGSRKIKSIHLLVLEAFRGQCPLGMEGCHNNGDRNDARLANLRWDTHTANMADRILHGTDTAGERNPKAKLSMAQVAFIRRFAWSGRKIARALSWQFDIHPCHVRLIWHGKLWPNVEATSDV